MLLISGMIWKPVIKYLCHVLNLFSRMFILKIISFTNISNGLSSRSFLQTPWTDLIDSLYLDPVDITYVMLPSLSAKNPSSNFPRFIQYVIEQPPRGVIKKRCSENMQQNYRRTLMSKCNFNWNHTSAWVFSCKFVAYFQNTFS